VLGVLLIAAPAARGQLAGKISMAKQEYLAGEPVYVHFEVTNMGKEAVQYTAGDAYSNGCGGYELRASRGAVANCRDALSHDCLGTNQMLSAGDTVRQNILLNFGNDVSKPGEYEIHAVRTLKYWPLTGASMMPANAKDFKYEMNLKLHVVPGDPQVLQGIYQVYVKNLGSADDEIQRDAERAIVSGAPPWLEGTIEGMLRKSTSREFALLGLKNLNTARSRQELAKIVQNTSEETTENVTAVEYLAEMGDRTYFPTLLELAKKEGPRGGREYVLAAAELGGEDAVPFLRELLENKNAKVRTSAVMGLGKTGSPEAVRILAALVRDTELGEAAEGSLMELTHRSARSAEEWEKWWETEGKSAKVFGPQECGEVREEKK
jgi:hypothetical protein